MGSATRYPLRLDTASARKISFLIVGFNSVAVASFSCERLKWPLYPDSDRANFLDKIHVTYTVVMPKLIGALCSEINF